MLRVTRYAYRLVNVFADGPFRGATVAVFTDATGLETSTMAGIARELNLPQSVFVFPSGDSGAPSRVRIFTPAVELPHAGLPMIAAVFALNLDRKKGAGSSPPSLPRERVVLEQAEGPVSVAVFAPVLTVRQAEPVFGSRYPERETIAALLSIRGDQIAAAPLEVVSSGIPYLAVPLKNVQALSQARLRESIWERTLQYFEAPNILAFAIRGAVEPAFAHLRVFTPAFGVIEESASESACGPLLGYVARHGLAAALPRDVVLRQGDELGRPATLHATCDAEGGSIKNLRVGGPCIAIGEGVIYV